MIITAPRDKFTASTGGYFGCGIFQIPDQTI